MADTTFIAQSFTTPIRAAWLNEVNSLVHKAFGNSADGITAQLIGLTATGIIGIGGPGAARAAAWSAVSAATTSGIVLKNLAIEDYNGSSWALSHNLDQNFKRVTADGSTYIYNSGGGLNIYSYATGTAGTSATTSTELSVNYSTMVIGLGQNIAPPAGQYQVSLFGNSWIHGALSETAGQVLTISQGSYRNSVGNFIRAFADEASQVVLRDGTVVLKCAVTGSVGSTITFVDTLTASPTDVTIGVGVTLGTSVGHTTTVTGSLLANGGVTLGNNSGDPLTVNSSTLTLNSALTITGQISSIDINGGTIDGVTVATSDITVGAAKTLNVSAGTLTLANDQISGDKVHGGTISTFASTGIDDNAVSNVVTLDSSGNIILGGGATASELRLLEPSGSGTNYTAFKAQAQSANVTYTLPPDDGDANEVLTTNGSGSLTWEPAPSPARTWQSLGTSPGTFTNSSSFNVQFIVAFTAGAATVTVGGVLIASCNPVGDDTIITADVPPGLTWVLTGNIVTHHKLA